MSPRERKEHRDARIVEVSAWLMVLLMLSVGVWSAWMIATH